MVEVVSDHQAEYPRDVPPAGPLPERALRVAEAGSVGAGAGERGAHRGDRRDPRHERVPVTGAPRIHAELRARERELSVKRMRAAEIEGVTRRRYGQDDEAGRGVPGGGAERKPPLPAVHQDWVKPVVRWLEHTDT